MKDIKVKTQEEQAGGGVLRQAASRRQMLTIPGTRKRMQITGGTSSYREPGLDHLASTRKIERERIAGKTETKAYR